MGETPAARAPRPSRGARLALVLVASIGSALLVLGCGLGTLIAWSVHADNSNPCVVEYGELCIDDDMRRTEGEVVDVDSFGDSLTVAFVTDRGVEIDTEVFPKWVWADDYGVGEEVTVAYDETAPSRRVALADDIDAKPLPDDRSDARTTMIVLAWITGLAAVVAVASLAAGIPWIRRAPRKPAPVSAWATAPYGAQPYGAQPYGAPAYGAQPYGAPAYGAQPYGVPAHGAPPMPPYGAPPAQPHGGYTTTPAGPAAYGAPAVPPAYSPPAHPPAAPPASPGAQPPPPPSTGAQPSPAPQPSSGAEPPPPPPVGAQPPSEPPPPAPGGGFSPPA